MTLGALTDAELSRWICENVLPDAKHLDGTREWRHNDMVHDPAMTVMLLEKMKSTEKIVICGDGHWYITRYEHEDFYSANSEYLGRAVAEAFALANGWKP